MAGGTPTRAPPRKVVLPYRSASGPAACRSPTRALGLGGKRPQDAELVAFRVGEHDPGLRPLTHVGMAGSQADQALHLGLLRAVNRADVKMQAVLDRLAFGHGHEHQRRDTGSLSHLLGQVSRFLLPGRDLHPVVARVHLITQDVGPERRLRRRVVAIDHDLGDPAYYEHHRCWVLFIARYRTLSVIPLRRTPPERVRWVSVDERHGLQAERVQRLQHLGYGQNFWPSA